MTINAIQNAGDGSAEKERQDDSLSSLSSLTDNEDDLPETKNKDRAISKGKRRAVDLTLEDKMDVDDQGGDKEPDDEEEEDDDDRDTTKRRRTKAKKITIQSAKLSLLKRKLAPTQKPSVKGEPSGKREPAKRNVVSSSQLKDHMVIIDLTGDVGPLLHYSPTFAQ